MGKMLDKFKKTGGKLKEKGGELKDEILTRAERKARSNKNNKSGKLAPGRSGKMANVSVENEELLGYDDVGDDGYDEGLFPDDGFDEIGIQPGQKPESFHHFILENQYKDLERSIRGVKDVWDKDGQKWVTKRKDRHCFTDEEAEDILRTTQSHLATDIKLGRIRPDTFGDYMDAVYKELAFLFESIAEYRYGRYNSFDKKGKLVKVNYDLQYNMKLQNQKIFLELWTRVQANYSRSIGGAENIATHNSVKGQESLQGMGDHSDKEYRSYT